MALNEEAAERDFNRAAELHAVRTRALADAIAENRKNYLKTGVEDAIVPNARAINNDERGTAQDVLDDESRGVITSEAIAEVFELADQVANHSVRGRPKHDQNYVAKLEKKVRISPLNFQFLESQSPKGRGPRIDAVLTAMRELSGWLPPENEQ